MEPRLGILPHVAYKAGVNTGGPRGALPPLKTLFQNETGHRREALMNPGL
jgi:hypothetical protein